MKTRASDIADFYEQLALLIRSDLPLPESLRQLGRYLPKRDFQRVILRMGEVTAGGDRFSAAIQEYPQFFDAFHVQLISAGEKAGTLPEVLLSVARLARFSQLMTSRMRDILAYPLLVIHLCLLVFLFLSGYVVPQFTGIYEDILGGSRLPALTEFVVGIGRFTSHYFVPLVCGYVAFFLFTAWLFTPWLASHRVLLAIVNAMPGSCRVAQSMDSARLCGMLSTFLRHSMPLPDAVKTAAQLVERSPLQRALERAAKALMADGHVAEVLGRERDIDGLIVLTFRHAPEQELAKELRHLADLFDHRVALAARSAAVTWSILALAVMALAVAFVVISLFMPLVVIVTVLGK